MTGLLGETLPGEMVLGGTWFVVRTTLPMWHEWHSPSLRYMPRPDGKLVDTVRAGRQGKTRRILGIDTPLPEPGAYEWRGGTPPTRWTPSHWKVAAHDPAGTWLVSLFAPRQAW